MMMDMSYFWIVNGQPEYFCDTFFSHLLGIEKLPLIIAQRSFQSEIGHGKIMTVLRMVVRIVLVMMIMIIICDNVNNYAKIWRCTAIILVWPAIVYCCVRSGMTNGHFLFVPWKLSDWRSHSGHIFLHGLLLNYKYSFIFNIMGLLANKIKLFFTWYRYISYASFTTNVLETLVSLKDGSTLLPWMDRISLHFLQHITI